MLYFKQVSENTTVRIVIVGRQNMKWISKILGRKATQHPSDPILDKCVSFAREFQVTLTDQEWNHVLSNRDKLAESPLGGAYVHKDVFYALCFLCLFDSLFEAGVELLNIGKENEAANSLEKARRLLPWPTVLYSLGLAYAHLEKKAASVEIWYKALDGFESRASLLSSTVPLTLPDRDNFISMTAERIDTTSSLSLGFTNFGAVKDNIYERLEKNRNESIS